MTAPTSPGQWPVTRLCPTHNVQLDGGPIQFHCPEGHGLVAADLYREYTTVEAS